MKIAYILFSNGLEYDDRIRKEMFSIREVLKGNVEFKVFAFSSINNRDECGVLSYGVPYEYVKVAYLDSKKKDIITMLRKEYSFYSKVAKKVEDFDLLWVCDDQPFFFPLFSKKAIIWDLHEIPSSILGSRLKNMLFHRMEKRSKWIIHANQERLNYLIQQGVVRDPVKNMVVRNYPDKSWLAEGDNDTESFKSFKKWLGDGDYIYLQGLSSEGRFAWESLSSVMEAHCIKAAVIGNVPTSIKEKLRDVYPDSDSYIYYVGQVVQSETSVYIANCKFSIVFYKANTPNNRYCEPNRMFQCLGMGKPVIVGCNEPMSNIIHEYGNGVALKSDGGYIEDIIEGINKMLNHYRVYLNAAEVTKREFSWEKQLTIFCRILENPS